MKHPEWLQGLVDADGREVELSQSPSLRELGMSAYDGGHDRLPTRLRQTRMSHGSRRWATLAACFAASACAGFGYAWSVYLKPMAAAHGWSGADVSLSYAALMSTAAAMPLVSGWALKYVRPRDLLLIGGAFCSASASSRSAPPGRWG